MLPIERPQKIICIGLNYSDHAEEQGVDLPERPLLFAKWPNTLIGPGEPIVHPADHRDGRLRGRARRRDRLRARAGCRSRTRSRRSPATSASNDVSARDLQFADGQWVRGKSLDTFCPVGPELVPASDDPDPQALGIRGDPQRSGDAGLDDGEHGVRRRRDHRLHQPGDHARAGRPDRSPARRRASACSATRRCCSKPGDEITIEIDGIGALTNPVTAE